MSETAISRLTISSPLAAADVEAEALLVDIGIVEISRSVQVYLKVLRGRGARQPAALILRPFDLDDSAPNAPSQRVAQGPARNQLKSTTRIPARAFMRETPSSADVQLSSISTPHLQRQPLVCGGAQQAEQLCSTLRPLSLASVREYRSGIQQGRQPMTDLPKHVDIHEEGPREGFQIEPGPISTADKIQVIEALAETGLHHIQACSFVSPRSFRAGPTPRTSSPASPRRRGSTTRRCGSTPTGSTAPCLPQQADDHRLDFAVRVRRLHAEEPAPQPCRQCRGDEEADGAAP